jgi:Kef-type K+ transport system membrane component KefB
MQPFFPGRAHGWLQFTFIVSGPVQIAKIFILLSYRFWFQPVFRLMTRPVRRSEVRTHWILCMLLSILISISAQDQV